MMSDTTMDSNGRGINTDTLMTLEKLGATIAMFSHTRNAVKTARVCKIELTRGGAAVSEARMMEFPPIGEEGWGFGVQQGNSDRLWFRRSADHVYHFEDSIFPREYSERECALLVRYLQAFLTGLTMP